MAKAKPVLVDEFHYHEVLDRAATINSMVDDLFHGHPVVESVPAIKRKVQALEDAAAALYQAAGKLSSRKS